jgi:tail tube protein
MTLGVGFLGKLGAGDESAYGTEALCTQMLPMQSEKITFDPKLQRSMAMEGRPQTRQADQGTIDIKGDVVTRLRYSLGNMLLKNWFGDLTDGQYTHLGTTDGLSMTLAIDKGVSVWTFTGCKTSKLVIDAKGDGVTLTASIIAHLLDQASTTNTAAVMSALIDPSRNVMFHHIRIRVGDHSAALDSSNEIGVTEFKLTLDRPMATLFTNESQGHVEAFENAFPNHVLEFKIPRYQSDLWEGWLASDTRLQVEIQMTDGTSTKTIYIPNFELDSVQSNISGPGAIPLDIKGMVSESEDSLTDTSISATGSNQVHFANSDAPYCYPGAAIYLSGFATSGNNGLAAVVSRTDSDIVITNAGAGGITLTSEGAGATVTVTTRSPDVWMTES